MIFPHSHGYSLVEVLVALLVLSAGVIGAAALQLSALQISHQSSLHTAAQQLAAEMAEWLQLVDDVSLERLQGLQMPGAMPSEAHCYSRQCSTDSLLQFIEADWIGRVQAALPEARVRICRDATPWDAGASAYGCESTTGEQA